MKRYEEVNAYVNKLSENFYTIDYCLGLIQLSSNKQNYMQTIQP